MSSYKYSCKLRQFTPIIHFQSDQKKATLRASELKPKLDRFLLSLKNETIKPSKGPQGELYFDYKVKIVSSNHKYDNVEKYNKYPPLYFGRDAKKFSSAQLNIEFISFDTKLVSVIKEKLPTFFALTNFGTRSTKGYGSFWVEEVPPEEFMKIVQPYYKKVYVMSKEVAENTWESVVGDFYKMLKMGNNHPHNPKMYKKSYLWEYFAQKGIRWEKRKIKQEFPQLAYSPKGNKPLDVTNPKEENFRFIRAMLGLPGQYEYRAPRKETVSIECSDENLTRMASPITFKVVGTKVYLLCNEHYKKLYDKTFTFKYKEETMSINTPKESEFELYDFMDSLVQKNILKVAQ